MNQKTHTEHVISILCAAYCVVRSMFHISNSNTLQTSYLPILIL